ncbi:MAG: hypothetical protein WCE80_05600 [Acidimicrobiia bacterium]
MRCRVTARPTLSINRWATAGKAARKAQGVGSAPSATALRAVTMTWETLDRKIDHFAQLVGDATGNLTFLPPDWKQIWSISKDIQSDFKAVKYPTRDHRQKAWERFASLRDRASREADAQKQKRQSDSAHLRNMILGRAAEARPASLFGLDPPDSYAMKDLGRVLTEARSMLSKYKTEMLAEHKQECFAEIQEIQALHDAWWADFKKERSHRQDDWRQRVRANLEKNYEQHRKATEALERRQRHAEKLRVDIASAWSDEFASRASDWLAEEEARIADIRASLARIESWIAEGEAKLA